MSRLNGTFKSAAIFLIIFSLFSTFSVSETYAANFVPGPAWVNGSPVVGQDVTLFSSFKAPSNVNTQQYMLDTEVFSAASGARVAQFFEKLQLNSAQVITRSYTWKTTGLAQGNYVFRQGLFTPDWKYNYGWNNQSGTTSLTGKAATPTPSPKPTAIPTVTPKPGSWQTAATLPGNSAQLNTTTRLVGTFGVATTGSYILDLELYDSQNAKVGQFYATRTVTAGTSQTLDWNWLATSGGALKVKMGIFSTTWQQKAWNDNAFNFTVNPGTTDPSPTPTPTPTVTPAPAIDSYMRGVNLAGAEFGADKLPGVYDIDYTYPTEANLDYYNSKGLKLIRLPFLWERLQRSLWGNLDQTELGRIDVVVAAAKARGMQIILDPHNYDRYRLNGNLYLIGSSQVPTAAFKDFWTKLAAHYKNEKAIYAFSLMNEPHDTNGTWTATAQAGLDGVRSSDTAHLVLVPGDAWSGAWSWKQNNGNLLLKDPSNNLMYEAHQYFDRDSSGTYNETYDASEAYPMIGADRVQPFIDWLKTNQVRGIITEYGVPNYDPRWQVVLDNFLTKLDSAGIGGTYWAGGPWWGDYALSSEPGDGKDKPVITTLVKHLSKDK